MQQTRKAEADKHMTAFTFIFGRLKPGTIGSDVFDFLRWSLAVVAFLTILTIGFTLIVPSRSAIHDYLPWWIAGLIIPTLSVLILVHASAPGLELNRLRWNFSKIYLTLTLFAFAYSLLVTLFVTSSWLIVFTGILLFFVARQYFSFVEQIPRAIKYIFEILVRVPLNMLINKKSPVFASPKIGEALASYSYIFSV